MVCLSESGESIYCLLLSTFHGLYCYSVHNKNSKHKVMDFFMKCSSDLKNMFPVTPIMRKLELKIGELRTLIFFFMILNKNIKKSLKK